MDKTQRDIGQRVRRNIIAAVQLFARNGNRERWREDRLGDYDTFGEAVNLLFDFIPGSRERAAILAKTLDSADEVAAVSELADALEGLLERAEATGGRETEFAEFNLIQPLALAALERLARTPNSEGRE